MADVRNIQLKDILVNLNNPRYEQEADEESEMAKILSDRNRPFELMKDIAKNGLDPSDLIILIYEESLGKYVVMEGNRRITALKVLNDPKTVPSSIKNRDQILKKIHKIIKEYNFQPIIKVQSVVYKSDDPLLKHFIELKHTGERKGAGRVKWDTESKARFSSTDFFRNYLIDFLKTVHKDIQDNFGLTTIERIISDPKMRVAIGLIVGKKTPEIKFVDKYSKLKLYYILDGLLSKKFNVKDFYHKSNREFFAEKHLLNASFQPWKTYSTEPSGQSNSGPNNASGYNQNGSSNNACAAHNNPNNDNSSMSPDNGASTAGPNSDGDTSQNASDNGSANPDPDTTQVDSDKGNPGGGYKPRDPSSFNKLTSAYKLSYYYKKNPRINKNKKELSDIEYKDFTISTMFLIRSLLESYVHEYIDLFASLPKEHKFKMTHIGSSREKRKGKELQDLIYNHIKNHLKDTIDGHAETYELIEVTFSKNNNTSAMKILNYHIHSSTHYPDKNEILEAWSKISTIINTMDYLLDEISGQK